MPKIFKAHPAQERFLLSSARYVGLIAGIGSGKTAAGAIKAIQKIQQNEDGIIVAPDFPQLSKSTFPEFMKWAPMSHCINAHLDHPFTQKKQLIFEINGVRSVVYYGGIEKESGWAGPNVNWAWFDEAARKRTRKAFDILAGRIRVGKNPQLWITTTPAGVNHWLYDLFSGAIFDPAAHKIMQEMGWKGKIVEFFTSSTEDNKDNLDPFHYQMLMGMYSGRLAQQELHGQFVTMEDVVWEMFDSRVGGRNITEDAEYHHGVPVEWWVDDGFTEHHPRVILFAQIIPPYVNVFDEYVARGELAEDSIDNALSKGYAKPSVALVDSSAAEFISRLWRKDIDTVRATHDVEEGIKRVASWICDGNNVGHVRFHPRCTYSRKEIPSYARNPTTGKVIKENDHVADCLRYGLWGKDREEIWGRKDEYSVASRIVLPEPSEVAVADAHDWYVQHWNGLVQEVHEMNQQILQENPELRRLRLYARS